jgi:hypothetical protein
MIEECYNGDIPASILSIAQALQGKPVAIEENLSCYQVPRDELYNDSSLKDQEPVVAPLESYAEFHEDEGEDLNAQQCSLVPSMSDDEQFQEEEPQVHQVRMVQLKAPSMPILVVVQEQLDQLPLQQEEPIFQPKDDVLTLCL